MLRLAVCGCRLPFPPTYLLYDQGACHLGHAALPSTPIVHNFYTRFVIVLWGLKVSYEWEPPDSNRPCAERGYPDALLSLSLAPIFCHLTA